MMTLLTLSATRAAIMNALANAEQYRREGGAWRTDCADSPGSPCPGHIADLGRADAYRQLRDAIAQASRISRWPAAGPNPAAGQ